MSNTSLEYKDMKYMMISKLVVGHVEVMLFWSKILVS